MRKTSLFLLVSAIVVSASPAEAKIRDKSWEFGAFVGHVDGDSSVGEDNGFSGGLTAAYNFTTKLAAELAVSLENASQSNLFDRPVVQARASVPPCSDPVQPTDPPCFIGSGTGLNTRTDNSNERIRAVVQVVGHFLGDRETSTMPYISAGFGVINETRPEFPFDVNFDVSSDDDMDTNTPRVITRQSASGVVTESFDSAALLTLAVGAKTFFSDNMGIRYEARYNHHDLFGEGQDEYQLNVGFAWVVGGQK
ncbi:MAG TPA: outer membrane beta-barrel protein [Candidatus Polarisedimenticolia bacterium]|nr:outer membrane beta-barrel protein [Candidatus Polarisedimenticolia bacterium]